MKYSPSELTVYCITTFIHLCFQLEKSTSGQLHSERMTEYFRQSFPCIYHQRVKLGGLKILVVITLCSNDTAPPLQSWQLLFDSRMLW